jgi:translation initiation factor IF-3
MRLAQDVAELGLVEQQPLLDGRNMTMVLGPTKNAGVKRDAEGENSERGEEALQAHSGREDLAQPAAPDDAAGPSGQEPPGEAEASPAGQVGRV